MIHIPSMFYINPSSLEYAPITIIERESHGMNNDLPITYYETSGLAVASNDYLELRT